MVTTKTMYGQRNGLQQLMKISNGHSIYIKCRKSLADSPVCPSSEKTRSCPFLFNIFIKALRHNVLKASSNVFELRPVKMTRVVCTRCLSLSPKNERFNVYHTQILHSLDEIIQLKKTQQFIINVMNAYREISLNCLVFSGISRPLLTLYKL